ncbi:hypothetical protein [Sphingomonas sp.]|uniref:hypothetical protein n=1 Tax=Sphingomonas sp. TaxID=28214 RepID=UPI00286DEAC5|nr:hypothetical protein [Sphingomonas sp.]
MPVIAARTSKSALRERRASPRRRLCLEVQAEISPGCWTDVIIHNLSRSGFVMEAAGSPAIGTRIHLRLLNDPVAARLIWNCRAHSGCEFERPLSSPALSATLLKSRPATAAEGLPPRLHFDPQGEAAAVASAARPARMSGVGVAIAASALLWAGAAALIL